MTGGHVAVIDIGKTNAKLALVDPADLAEVAVITRPNTVRPGPPWPHFDTEGHWQFLLDGLRDFHSAHGISAISVTTHGACAALLDEKGGLAAPILDYEHDGPDDLSADYDALRPGFSETGSPRLGMGLNLGAQLHWMLQTDPGLRTRTARIVTYPQYWGFRLTGVAATDVTSLGCHTDLWLPAEGRFSPLVDTLGLGGIMAPPRRPDEVLGPITPEVAQATGLPPETPVQCGIHDSNASLLPHLRSQQAPFSVVSTGTWVIAMSIGGTVVDLDPGKDTLINVNALGAPVPSARFMGGREHDIASGGAYPDPDESELAAILRDGIMLLPAVEPGSGPFRGRQARWVGAEPAPGSGRRGAALAFYLALMTAHCLRIIGHAGQIVVEGPFARNRAYARMLAAATGDRVIPSGAATGTSQGAALLVDGTRPAMPAPIAPADGADPLTAQMRAYADLWQYRSGA
ncbi:FGGY-family carbohydrate kinase [Mameliella alba]|uniref:Carbohydrate kinase n=1 Tax=Mameliella alba TaxID=561184 RepID=A0A0B3RHW0_9RHOB|nr:FGGY-family carbohydrate kinase [Mameliella alba]KHQ50880.1 Carbohydrate kinase [Mameliella alba]